MEGNKSVMDTRTFPEIWKALTPVERGHLRYQLLLDTTCTRQTINNWANGVRPVHLKTRNTVANTIGRVLGIRTSRALLFPENR